MRTGAVAARYARALFELAREQGQLERVEADVEHIARELDSPAAAAFLLSDRRVPAKERDRHLEALAAHLCPLTANFVRLLREKRRLEVLRELRDAFRQQLLAERGEAQGEVQSARELPPAALSELGQVLSRLLGKRVALEHRLQPELIAGVRVLVDNRLLDQSAAGRLEELRGRLLAARLS